MGERGVVEVQVMRVWVVSLAIVSAVAGGDGLLNQESIAKAKDVKIQIFNQTTGKPAGSIGYHVLEKTRPRLGPLTVNLQVLRVKDFVVEVELEESEGAGFNDQLAKFMQAAPLRFIEASPAKLLAKQDGEGVVELSAGRAKYDRRGGIFLAGGVKWKVRGKEGEVPEARLVHSNNSKTWMLLDTTGKNSGVASFQLFPGE